MKTKKLLAAVLSVIMLLSSAPLGGFVGLDLPSLFKTEASAAELSVIGSGKCGENLTWSLDSEGTLTISGTGRMDDFTYTINSFPMSIKSNAPWTKYAEKIRHVVIKNGVTSIGDYAFVNLIVDSSGSVRTPLYSLFTSVEIPDSVTSIGENAFYGCNSLSYNKYDNALYLGNAENPYLYLAKADSKSITSCKINEKTKTIGNYAFSDCYSLTSITIPDSVTNIGYRAFDSCTSLTSITIGNSVTSIGVFAFSGCNSLSYNKYDNALYLGNTENPYLYLAKADSKSITSCKINEKTKTIGNYAFSDCYSLTSIEIPCSVTIIGDNAFNNCMSLTSFSVSEANEHYSSDSYGVLYNKNKTTLIQYPIGNSHTYFTIPESVTSIGSSAFSGCKSLTNVTIGNSVTSIGSSAFSGCYSLASVEIPNSVTSIGNSAFSGCRSLTSVTIGNSVTSIGDSAFRSCDSLTSITIPNSVTSIGSSVFYNCTSLTQINYNAKAINNLSYSSEVFYNAGTSGSGISIVFGDNVEKIPAYLFYVSNSSYSPRIISVTIGNSVTSIGSWAFSECSSLTSVTIPDSVTSIGSSAFRNCTGLTSVTIGEGVTSIGGYAFSSCSNLEKVVFKGKAPTINSTSFSGCEITAFYPYKEDGWKSAIKSSYGGNFKWVLYSKNTLEKLEVDSSPKKTVYIIGDKIDFNGLSLKATWSDGLVETVTLSSVQFEELRLSKSVADKVGENIITASYCGKETKFKVYAHNLKDITVNPSEYPESKHNYADNLNETKTFSYPDAIKMRVTFSDNTFVEKDGDYIYVNGTKYTGDSLAGRTISFIGNKLTIKLTSDEYGNYYGYSIDKIEVTAVEHTYKTATTPATLIKNGKIETKCSVCGNVSKSITIYSPKTFTLSATEFTYTGKEIKPTVTVKDSNGKTIASSNYTVSYSSNVNAGTGKVTIKFKGNYSGTKTVNFTITPKQVTGLKVSDEKTTSLKLSWSKTGGAKYYKVEQSTDGKKWKTVTTTDKTSYTVKSLKAGTKYQFRVTALDSTKKIAGKTSSVLKTGTLTSVPTLTLKSTKSKTATASWKKVTGASKYAVYKSTNGKKWTKVTTTTKTSYNLTKLTGGKKIYVKITALNAYSKASAYSGTKNVTVKK